MCFHFQCANELKNERQFLFVSFAFRLVQCTTKIIITNNKMELCDKNSRRQRKGQKERESEWRTQKRKRTKQTNKLTKMICGISLVLWRKCRAFVAICWNCICCIKSLLTKKKIWLLFAISSFRRIDLSHSHGTKPQNNTKTNDNGNCNLACFIQTHYFQYADIYAIP